MARPMNEKQVLKKLGVEDFRHVTKDQVITLTSMLDRMDPEVAKKALEQFPEFAKLAKEMIAEEKRVIEKALEKDGESEQAYYDACKRVLDSLDSQLQKEDLSEEERSAIINEMLGVVERMSEKDSEGKKFKLDMVKTLVAGGSFVIAVAAVALGSNTKIDTSNLLPKK